MLLYLIKHPIDMSACTAMNVYELEIVTSLLNNHVAAQY